MDLITFKQIGVIHSPFKTKEETPIQSIRSTTTGTIELYHDYIDGLIGLDEFSHIYLFYSWHKAAKIDTYTVTPFLDNKAHGVFATRYPSRPNALGFSVVQLLRVERNILTIKGVDVLDGTPLLDIKPYVPDFDHFTPDKIGWYGDRAYE